MYTSMFGCDAPQSTDPAYNSAATEDVAYVVHEGVHRATLLLLLVLL